MNEQKAPPARTGLTRFEFLSLSTIALGFAGFGILTLLRLALGMSDRQFMANSAGGTAVWICAGLTIVGLGILCPIAVFVRRYATASQRGRPMPWWGIVFIPFGLGDPEWMIPRWITWPMMAILVLLLVSLVTVMVVVTIVTSIDAT